MSSATRTAGQPSAAARPSFPVEPRDPATGMAPAATLADVPAAAYPAGAPGSDPAERGRTVVSRQAVERITARLVADCPGVEGAARRRLGGQAGEPAVAWLHGTRTVSLAVRCAVPYPNPVRASAEALRQLLVTRVGELTGMRVQRVDVIVTGLPATERGRRVR